MTSLRVTGRRAIAPPATDQPTTVPAAMRMIRSGWTRRHGTGGGDDHLAGRERAQRSRRGVVEPDEHVVEHQDRCGTGAVGDEAMGPEAQRQCQRALFTLRKACVRRHAVEAQLELVAVWADRRHRAAQVVGAPRPAPRPGPPVAMAGSARSTCAVSPPSAGRRPRCAGRPGRRAQHAPPELFAGLGELGVPHIERQRGRPSSRRPPHWRNSVLRCLMIRSSSNRSAP